MPFEKGRDKTGGRQKGTPNKTSEETRKLFRAIMDSQQDRIKEALSEIYKQDKKQYLYILNRYFPYYMPKQLEIDATIQNNDLPFTIEIEHRKKEDNSE